MEYQQFIELLLVGHTSQLEAYMEITKDKEQLSKVLQSVVKNKDYKDINTSSLLHAVASIGMIPSIQWLIKWNGEINAVDEEGNTPLLVAAANGHMEAVRMLYSSCGNLHAANERGDTALHLAARINRADIVDFILQEGINPDIPNKVGDTALHIAIRNVHIAATKVLVLGGADVNIGDANERRPLHIASSLNQYFLVKLLLKNFSMPYKVDKMGILPVSCTTMPEIKQLLMEAMKTLSTAFRQFEEIIDRTDVLGKQTKRELICLYHNYELLDMMSYVHKSRFDYSASVVSEDWKSVERYAEDIMSRRRKAYLVFQMNIDDNQNDGPAKPSLFYEKEEMIAKASTILQSIEQKLSETAVRAIQETDALPTVRAYTAIRHTLLTIIGREEVEDRNKFLNSLSLSTIYRERSAAPENQVAITGTMREQSGDSSPDASGASKLRRFI